MSWNQSQSTLTRAKLWQKYRLSRGYRLEGEIDSDFYLVILKSIPYARDPRYISKQVTFSQGNLT